MHYDIACKNCEYKKEVNITLIEYEELLKSPCPTCKKIKLYQDFSKRKTFIFELKGFGWAGKTVRKGSQDELDKVLKENDYLSAKGQKHEHIDNSVAKGYNQERKNEKII